MAEKYETRPFEYVNNKDCRFYEASVNGKYLYQEFLIGLKDKKNDIRVYVIMRKPNVLLWEAIKVNKTPILNELRNYSMTFKRK